MCIEFKNNYNRAFAIIDAPRPFARKHAPLRPACAPLATLTKCPFCACVCVFVCTATLEVAPHVAVGSREQAALPEGVGAAQGGHQRQHQRPTAAPRSGRPQRSGFHLLQPRR